MKILKRILTLSFAVLVIFCILCTSVFASESPSFGLLDDLDSLSLYAPSSNLQSILAKGDDQYYSFISPFSLLNEDPFAKISDNVLSDEYVNELGLWKAPGDSSLSRFSATTTYFYSPSQGGSFARSVCDFTDLGSFRNSLDVTFVYGSSALPLSSSFIDSSIPGQSSVSGHPDWSSLYFDVGTFEFAPPNFYLDVEITASVMSFRYGFGTNPDRYHFALPPTWSTINISDKVRMNRNEFLEEANGFPVFSQGVSLYSYLSPYASSLMEDFTIDAAPLEYMVFDSIRVRVTVSTSDPLYDDSNTAVLSVRQEDYYLFDNELQRLSPDLDDVIYYFTDSYPVYELPQSVSDLNFTDFLVAVMSIFDVPLIGTFTLSQLLFGVAGIGLLIWFLKMFAGG